MERVSLMVVGLIVLGAAVVESAAPIPQESAVLERGCQGGKAVDCNELALLYDEGRRVPRDPTRAAALYERACRGDVAVGCANLGRLYKYGEGVPQDFARAAALYRQACAAALSPACTNLGVQYENGTGVPRDLAGAAILYKQGCQGGNALGCQNLGALHANGAGVPKDLAYAATLFQMACDAGNALGCSNLASSYENASGVPKDAARAAALYKLACDGREAPACISLRALYMEGIGVPRDLVRADALLVQACQLGWPIGCKGKAVAPGGRAGGEEQQVCARHILIKVTSPPRDSAAEAESEARSLATGLQVSLTVMAQSNDFADLAQRFSEDENSAARGGDIGCFARGEMVREVENVAFALKVDEISELVKSSLGFHIIQRTRNSQKN